MLTHRYARVPPQRERVGQRDFIVRGLESVIESARVTYDLARQTPVGTTVATSAFGHWVIRRMAA